MVSRLMPPWGATSVGVVVPHQLGGALDHPGHAGGADEHVMGLLLEHEVAGAAERIEGRLPEGRQLELAVPVGEVGEEEKREPVGGGLVERTQDPRPVDIARMALEQGIGLLPSVPAEEGVQQVDHGPQVPAFLDVDLKQVAQVVQARRRLHRGGAAARPTPARCRPAPRSAGAGRRGTRPGSPARRARPCARRSRSADRRSARRGRCPTGSPGTLT